MTGPEDLVVAPFFRASVAIGAEERRLFARGLEAAPFESAVRARPWILRQNLRRLLAAALVAESRGAPLVLVEGWRSNAIVRPGRAPRFVSGSWIFAALLRLLRRRGIVGSRIRVVRREISRCTWDEARGIAAVAASGEARATILGIADDPCPSAARAARYVRAGGTVITPAAALATVGPLTAAQRGLWDAAQPRAAEALLAPLVEAPNWVLHATSEMLRAFRIDAPTFEARLARTLRKDGPVKDSPLPRERERDRVSA